MSSQTPYEEEVIVIDSGTEMTRIGLAGGQGPALVKRTCVGKPRRRESIASGKGEALYVGEDALAKHRYIHLSSSNIC